MLTALGLLPALLLGGAAGCSKTSPAAQPAAKDQAPVTKVVHPQRGTVRRTIEQPGYIMAIEHTPIYARISGYVSEVCVDMNSAVAKGQVLARIAVPEMEQDVLQKKALLEQAKAMLVQAQAGAASAAAIVEAAQAMIVEAQSELMRVNAELEFRKVEHQRYVQLRKDNAIRSELVDEKQNQLLAAESALTSANAKISTARANLKVEQAKYVKAQADVGGATAGINVAESNVEQARIMLAYREIVAPFDGIVTERNVHTGHLVKSGQTGNAEPMFVLVRSDRVRIFVEVPEGDAESIRPESQRAGHGTIVHLRVQASTLKEIEAPVTRTSWALDPANRTLRVEIELPTAATDLRPGMYAYASFTIEHAGAWCLPASSIITRDDGNFCYRVEHGKALLTPVRIGVRDKDLVQVLKQQKRHSADASWDDFQGSEQIVLANSGTLTDGQPVDVTANRD
jgi:RND family efflux transporter MFP subunit